LEYDFVTELICDENGDLLADSHNISIRWKNYFSQLSNVHGVSDIRQIEIDTAQSVCGPCPYKIKIAFVKLKRINRQIVI
jgi:hypothetical protein